MWLPSVHGAYELLLELTYHWFSQAKWWTIMNELVLTMMCLIALDQCNGHKIYLESPSSSSASRKSVLHVEVMQSKYIPFLFDLVSLIWTQLYWLYFGVFRLSCLQQVLWNCSISNCGSSCQISRKSPINRSWNISRMLRQCSECWN